MAHTIFSQRQGKGSPLLLVHGLMVNGAMFEPLFPLLAPHHTLLTPDLRGHGRSQQLPPPYTVKQHARDLAHLLDEAGFERVDVLGYSQGGPVVQQFAYDYPGRVRRLFLVCTYAYNMLTLREKVEGMLMPWMVRLFSMERLAQLMASTTGDLSPEQTESFTAMVASNQKPQALAAIDALKQFDSRGWLHEIGCRAWVIAGARDEAVPLHHAKMLHEGIPDSKLHIIEGAGHMLAWTHTHQLTELILKGTVES